MPIAKKLVLAGVPLRRCHRALVGIALSGTISGLSAPGLQAQSLLERTPNVTGDWVGVPGTLHFNFLHRFTAGDAPARKVVSSPTFLLAVGLPKRTLVGFNYATNSTVAPAYPNEWEPFVRWAPLEQEDGDLFDIGLQAGYNVAARSADGEASVGQRIGPVRVRAAARYLSDAYALGDSRTVLAGGAILRFGRYVAVSGDYAAMLNRPDAYDNVWSGGLQLAIPYSPHTISLQVTNANSATLQGISAASGSQRRYGFEFTIPVTLARYFRKPTPTMVAPDSSALMVAPVVRPLRDSASVRRDSVSVLLDSAVIRLDSALARRDSAFPARDTVRVPAVPTLPPADTVTRRPAPAARDTVATRRPAATPAARRTPTTATGRMRQFTFSPGRLTVAAGTTITWTNTDPVAHTITADDGSWSSGIIDPGKVWQRRFDRPGTYAFHCTPHPFMKGVVVVRGAP